MRKLRINKTNYKISDFITWQKAGQLKLSPSFQRRPVWTNSMKSYLIDSVIRGLPIPIIFLRERIDLTKLEPIREVVDGQQRLRTIITFITPETIKNLKDSERFKVQKSHNNDFGEKNFSELPEDLQRDILNYEFSVHVLPSQTEDSEVLQIFARMNSTGMKLNYQELRNAEFFGAFKQFAYELSYKYLEYWRDWKIFSERSIARMLEVEFTSELIYFMHNGIDQKTQSSLNEFYRKYEENYANYKVVESRFSAVMEKINILFDNPNIKKAFKSKPRFYGLFAVMYHLLFGSSLELQKKHPSSLPNNFSEILNKKSLNILNKNLSETVIKAISRGTSNRDSRLIFYNYLLEEHI